MSNTNNMVVETTGAFMLQDVSVNQDVQPHRPSVVRNSPFIQQRIATKQLAVVEPETDLTDDELHKLWLDGKYKKSKKQPVKHPPRPGDASEAKPSDAPAPKPSEPVKFRDQNDGESDDEYLKALDAWEKEQPKKD